MKKIDIEKWERKVPKLTEHFFDEMQKNVLEQTTQKQKTKVFKLNFFWSSAAAIVVILGLYIFINANNQNIENHSVVKIDKEIKNLEKPNVSKEILVENEANDIPNDIEKTKSKFVLENPNHSQRTEVKASAKPEIDKVLNAMTEEELMSLANTYEQDLYLELY